MGCGKSKHDVVTGNTKTVRKPTEVESVKGIENETIKRQESCRCQKTNDISAVVSDDRLETTVDNNTKKPQENEAEGDCNEKVAVETNDVKKPEDTETEATITLPPVTEIVPENVVTEETVPMTEVVPGNVVTEETVEDVNENVLPADEQKEKIDTETEVEEEKTVEGKNDGDGDTEIQLPEAEELQTDVLTEVTTELEVEEVVPTENVEISAEENVEIATTENVAATETNEVPVLKDEYKVDVVEEKPAEITKEVESA
ncbi:hypothetical protein AALP_AAs50914U000300 [Arabis alpina]|uniref:Uncharacterized protein n=1 Tax=Arabis alpina TaxID=50452 RepID=A0A087FZA9_ARAAL|nr:hypothetical protein AALP_AAs50914U000300 [Arabis alpina]